MKYPHLGPYLINARLAAGIRQQAEFAAELGVAQQTVSRWEKGISRPRVNQIADIVGVLNCDPEELNSAAGYAGNFPQQPGFDKPWPLNALSSDSFERFCTDLLHLLYSDADVHRYGDAGHKQDGLDIEAIFPSGTIYTFQCKRIASFGPRKIEIAVLEHTKFATKKIILVSCLASPQAREAIKKYPAWELWDREDASRLIRLELSKSDQVKLADIYFPSHRFALTGQTEPSLWQTPDEFFSGLLKPDNSFSHTWNLVGRETEMNTAMEAISGAEKTVIFLRGNGGSGKSKVLREISLRVREKFPTKRILFLSRDSLTQKNIESLPPGPKLLVCDDAHDRDDLRSLFSFASDTENETKLIVALRTYGKELVKKQAPDLTLKEVQEIDLPKMSVADAKALATQALQRYQGNLGLAEPLALLTRDCPLATVIGAQVASEENSRPEFLLNEDSFRFVIMSRLVDTIARDVSSGLSAANVENVLKSIAIVQPLSDNDTVSLDAITKISGVNSNELAQIIRRLKDAGVLFVRAEVMRISPDLLGDFLVENSCISENGQSTGFAERAFDVVPEIYTDHIMLNLGKLDWIKSNGDTRQSHVLDELWDRIRGNQNHRYTSLLARTPLAYFQPKQALRFVERKMQEDHTDEDLPKIIRNIAYHPEYLPKACELLWQLGQHDSRQTNRTPSHPVRLLSELAAPGPTNSIDSIAIVVEYAIELIPLESSWTSNHSPLTILTNTLNTEGYTSTSTRRTWAMQPYQISSIAMKSLRQQVIGACIKLLSHPNTRRGYMAAELLKKAVQLPMGMFNVVPTQEQTNQWLEEYCETLDAIYNSLVATPINPIVFNQLAKAVSWHAIHFDGITKEPAKKILTLQNLNLHVRTVNMLMSQWENAIAPAGAEYSIEQRNSALKSFSIELQAAYPDPNLLHRYLRRNLDEIEFASSGEHRWSFGLVDALASSSAAFAEILVNEAMFQKNGIMSKFVGSALTKLLVDVPNIAEQFIAKAFDEQNEQAVMHVAIAYSRFLPENGFTKFDVETIKKLVTSSSGSIVKLAAGALGNLAWKNQEVALGMVGLINFGIDGDAADEHLMWLNNNKSLPFDKLSPDQIRQILNRLIRLDNIDGYWVKEFLHKAFKQDTYSVLNFFMQRIELALASPNTGYSPVPFNSYPGHTFSLTTLPNSTELINALLEQARAHSDNVLFRYHFAKLLEYLCAPYDATFLELLETSLDLNGNSEMNLFLMILGEAPSNLVFSNEDFVRRFLVSAKSLGPKVLEHSLYVFFQCGIGGIRSGVPGEPYPQDMALRDSAHETLSRLGRFEPAYQLYSELLEYAEAEITREKRAGRIFDEMEE